MKEGLQNRFVQKPFQIIKKYQSEEFTIIEHKPGQVVLLVYWEDIQVQSLIEVLTDILKENVEKWGQAVRVIALSFGLAEDSQVLIENNEESFKYIDFYFPKEYKQSDSILYGIQYAPHFLFIDKFGTIRISSHCEDVKYQIEKLINEQTPPEKTQIITQDSVDKVLEILQSVETNEKWKKVDQAQIIELDVQFEQVLIERQIQYKVPSLNLFCRDYQLETVQQVLNQIYQLIPENDWEINKTVSKTFSVPYPGLVCSVCNKDITNEPQQYYSPFKKVHLCVECAEFDDKTKKGLERFKCTDNLVFINGPLADLSVLENIDDHKIGMNLQIYEWEEGRQCPDMQCNGCQGFGKDIIGPRYIAVSAKPGKYREGGYVDYCQNCFVELKNKESEKAQAIVQKDAGYGMVKDSLLVRILFSHGYSCF